MRTQDAARWFAERGVSVWPAYKDKKNPIGFGWNKDHSPPSDPEQIVRRFDDYPDANIYVVSRASGLVIVDQDPRNGGLASFKSLCDDVGLEAFAGCPIVQTPGGLHYYFRTAGRIVGGDNKLGPGIDVQANVGVMAPPSRRSDGDYTWRTPRGEFPEEFDPPPFPDVLAKRLRKRAAKAIARNLPGAIERGRRNVVLTEFAGRLRWMGLTESELAAVISRINSDRCRPPLGESEVWTIAKSVARYDANDVDPLQWLSAWQRAGLSPQELRLSVALTTLAARACGPLTPAEKTVTEQASMDAGNYRRTRQRLKERNAIRVLSRGRRLAPLIDLLLPHSVSP